MFNHIVKIASGVGRAVTDKPSGSLPATPYKNSIGDRRFRLCRIQKDPSERGGFSLAVREFDLDSPPTYCAVSYTWASADLDNLGTDRPGAEERIIPILVNQIRVRITQNLFDFLQQCVQSKWFHASHKPEKGEVAHDASLFVVNYLWIDAVSINQDSTEDRIRHRSIVGEIYLKSAPVPIWLGKEVPNPYVRWVLEEFIPAFNKAFPQPGSLKGKDPMCTDPVFTELLGQAACRRWRDAWIPFMEFLGKKRWFRRGWAVQEVIVQSLTKNGESFLLFGYYSASWLHLRIFLSLLHLDDWNPALVAELYLHGFTSTANRTRDLFGSVANITAVRNSVLRFRKAERARKSVERRPSVSTKDTVELDPYDQTEQQRAYTAAFRVLQIMMSFKFSDHRDNVYVSFDILNFLAGDGLQLQLETDYNSPVVDVYTSISWHFLSHMSSLEVLTRATNTSMQHRIPGLPSWVPDFSKRITANFFQTARTKAAVNNRGRLPRFDASNMPLRRPILQGPTRLSIAGTRLDKLSSCSPSLVRASKGGWDYSWMIRACKRLGSALYQPTSEPIDEAFTRTLLVDSIPKLFSLDKCPDVFQRFWLHIFATTCRSQPPLQNTILESLRSMGDQLQLAKWLPDAAAFSNVIEKRTKKTSEASLGQLFGMADRLWSARVCFCTNNNYIGMGNFRAEVGDEVWLLEGGRTPFILRRLSKENEYQLIGEAYLHGFMYGEGMTQERRSNLESVVIA
ncbi:unnamed protein product [Clonostachys solani]|uniref:Heterokaryon incompatibility domain-containing protein n=1 Tax=Clonostachys solani TaxID=160281 RepID=A0A9N9W8N1_9HYPO|nr:unnamed protein product [Clonostachys solani]